MLWLARRTGSVVWHSCVTFHIATHSPNQQSLLGTNCHLAAGEKGAHVHSEEEVALLPLRSELAACGETLERGLLERRGCFDQSQLQSVHTSRLLLGAADGGECTASPCLHTSSCCKEQVWGAGWELGVVQLSIVVLVPTVM